MKASTSLPRLKVWVAGRIIDAHNIYIRLILQLDAGIITPPPLPTLGSLAFNHYPFFMQDL